jgi:hypothetical protein
MAKLTRNAFIEKHKHGTLVVLDFADARILKRQATTRTKQATKKVAKPQVKLLRARDKDGKDLPTPNQIVQALAKAALKGDYFIESGVAGTVQSLFIADDTEAKALADSFPHAAAKRGDGRPAKLAYNALVDGKTAGTMARNLKLM